MKRWGTSCFVILLSGLLSLTGCGSTTTAPTVTTPSNTSTPIPTELPAASSAATSSTASAAQQTFVIADVGSTPTTSIATFQPLADYLVVKLAPLGITNVTIKVAPDFDTIAKWLKNGDADMLFQTAYPAILLQDAVGAQSILRRWKDGDAEYYSVIFARADSGLLNLSFLQGKMLAVQDAFSTSAYMLPLAHILNSGFKIARKDSPTSSVAANEVGYTSSAGDANTLQWVISGKVAAGTTDIRHYEQIPDESRKQLVVLAETAKLPRGVVMVRPGMNPALLDLVKTVLIAMDKSDEGKVVLGKIQKTNRFDELPGGADAALAQAKALTKLLKEGVTN